MPADHPEPLSAEDEVRRLLRGQFAYCINPEGYYPGDITHDYDDIIEQAIATLDAARAVPVAGDLAEALDELDAAIAHCEPVRPDEEPWVIVPLAVGMTLRAALRVSPDSTAGLDVEALGSAISQHAANAHWCGVACGPDVARLYADKATRAALRESADSTGRLPYAMTLTGTKAADATNAPQQPGVREYAALSSTPTPEDTTHG